MTADIAPSRRTVAKGAVWTVPALTVAAAAPQLAASACEFVMDAGATGVYLSRNTAVVDLDLTLTRGTCGATGALGLPLTVTFSYPGGFGGYSMWNCSDVTPTLGAAGATATTNQVFDTVGETGSLFVTLTRVVDPFEEHDPLPITLTFSAPGMQTEVLTIDP